MKADFYYDHPELPSLEEFNYYNNLLMKRQRETSSKQAAKRSKTGPSMDQIVERKVKKELAKNVDWKVTDVTSATTNMTINATVVDLQQNMARGDLDLNNFTGNTVFPKWLEIRWVMRNLTTETLSHVARLVVGQQVKGSSVPTGANLFQTTNTTGLSAVSPFNNDYHEAFKILHDELVNLDFQGPDSLNNIVRSGKIFIPGWKLKKIDFTAANVVPLTGGLFMAFCIQNTAAVLSPTISYYTRIKYKGD